MFRTARRFFVFAAQTLLLAGALFGLVHILQTRDISVSDSFLVIDDEIITQDWPIKLSKKNAVLIQGVLFYDEGGETTFTLKTKDCPTSFLVNEIDIRPLLSCQTVEPEILSLSGALVVGENPFEIKVQDVDDVISFDIRSGTGVGIPRIVNLHYIWNDGAPVKARMPLQVDKQQKQNLRFVLDVPFFHSWTYQIGLQGCLSDVVINDLQVDDVDQLCGKSTVNWGKYLHAGKNLIEMNLQYEAGVLAFNITPDPEDKIFLILKMLIGFSVGLYGIWRLP